MSGSLDVLGMLNPGMAGFAAAPALDYGSALGAMNPGMTGFGGGATSVGGFDAMAPLTDNSSWLDRNFGNISSKGVADALGQLGKGAGGGQAAGAGKGPIMPGGGPAAGIGGGRGGGVSLDALVQMLAKRREALMGSATGGVGAGQVPQTPSRTGLLGF